jgi:hypothetical protein
MLRSLASRSVSVLAIAWIAGCMQPAEEETRTSGSAVGEKPSSCASTDLQIRLARTMEAAVARRGWGSWQLLELLRTDVASTCQEVRNARLLETCTMVEDLITPVHFARHDQTRVAVVATELEFIVAGYVRGTSLSIEAPAKGSSCETSLEHELLTAMQTGVARQHPSWIGRSGMAVAGFEQFREDIRPVCDKARSTASEADVDETCDEVNDLATFPEGEDGSLALPRAGNLMRFVDGYARALEDRGR